MPMSDHQHLRHLLQEAGLKASLPRLKVLEVLCDASQESGGISTRLLHERLNAAGEPLADQRAPGARPHAGERPGRARRA